MGLMGVVMFVYSIFFSKKALFKNIGKSLNVKPEIFLEFLFAT